MGRGIVFAALVLLVLGFLVAAVVATSYRAVPESGARTEVPTPVPGALGSGSLVQSSWYTVFFTQPVYPDDPAQHRGGLDERLVSLLDRAETTLDVAGYDFDLQNVAQAMARARQRGVRVRMVTDSDTVANKNEEIQAALAIVRGAGIPIVEDGRSGIMHHKFTVVDNAWVSTGSWNYTDGDTYRLNNWMGIFHSSELAANYTAEFEQLFAGKFGGGKRGVLPHPAIALGGSQVQTCFSPQGKCDRLIVRTIEREARRAVRFLAFSFTHDQIGQAILEKASMGIRVAGVFETTGSQTQYSEYGRMKAAGLEVYTDGSPWALHHKVILIDDRIVVAGSFNFSQNATATNDENLLVLEDPALAQGFATEFDYILQVAQNPPAR
ncbi:MAG: phospholipase [Chloroflexi bacterium]|nr:phospholipase [Chloroflexota bacterium]